MARRVQGSTTPARFQACTRSAARPPRCLGANGTAAPPPSHLRFRVGACVSSHLNSRIEAKGEGRFESNTPALVRSSIHLSALPSRLLPRLLTRPQSHTPRARSVAQTEPTQTGIRRAIKRASEQHSECIGSNPNRRIEGTTVGRSTEAKALREGPPATSGTRHQLGHPAKWRHARSARGSPPPPPHHTRASAATQPKHTS